MVPAVSVLLSSLRLFLIFWGLVGKNVSAELKIGDCRDCLIVSNFQDYHGDVDWDVCEKGLPRCWKFKNDAIKDVFLNAYISAKKAKGLYTSIFQTHNLFAMQDVYGNRRIYDESGRVAYFSRYGHSFKILEKTTTDLNLSFSPKVFIKNNFSSDLRKVTVFDKLETKVVDFKSVVMIGIRETNMDINKDGEIKDALMGTGIITGSNCDVLITAAHVLKGPSNKLFSSTYKNYFARQSNKNKTEENTSEILYFSRVVTGYDSNSSKENNRYSKYDWAVVRLSKPANNGCIRDLEMNFYYRKKSCSGRRILVGYDKSEFNEIFESYNCTFGEDKWTKKEAEAFGHRCDTFPGSSGAPILCEYNDQNNNLKYRLEGIHIEGLKDGEGKPIKRLSTEIYPDVFNTGIFLHGQFVNNIKSEISGSENRKNHN